jgi:hypothetical protein
MGKQLYFYVIVQKENGYMRKEDGRITLWLSRKDANEQLKRFNPGKWMAHRIRIGDLEQLAPSPTRPTGRVTGAG